MQLFILMCYFIYFIKYIHEMPLDWHFDTVTGIKTNQLNKVHLRSEEAGADGHLCLL